MLTNASSIDSYNNQGATMYIVVIIAIYSCSCFIFIFANFIKKNRYTEEKDKEVYRFVKTNEMAERRSKMDQVCLTEQRIIHASKLSLNPPDSEEKPVHFTFSPNEGNHLTVY